jgi:hypothetical protein
MSLLLHRPLLGCATFALGLSGATYGLLSHQRRHPLRLDSSSNPLSSSSSTPKDWTFSQYQRDAQTPVVTSRGGLNAKAVRQMTLGSILGTFTFTIPNHMISNPLKPQPNTLSQASSPALPSPSSANP